MCTNPTPFFNLLQVVLLSFTNIIYLYFHFQEYKNKNSYQIEFAQFVYIDKHFVFKMQKHLLYV